MITSDTIDAEAERLARVLWDYLTIQNALVPCDFLLVLGSHDTRVAEKAAELFKSGYGTWFVATGGFGKVTRSVWDVPEAVRFGEIARALGVPADRIIIEPSATNTGDNVVFSRALLTKLNLPANTAIIVTKPYMTRRAIATALKQWPTVHWLATAPDLPFEAYADTDSSKRRMINLLVGDVQRMKIYGAKGFQIPMEVPPETWSAFENLVRKGFDEFVIRE